MFMEADGQVPIVQITIIDIHVRMQLSRPIEQIIQDLRFYPEAKIDFFN